MRTTVIADISIQVQEEDDTGAAGRTPVDESVVATRQASGVGSELWWWDDGDSQADTPKSGASKELYASYLEQQVRSRTQSPGSLLEVRAKNSKEAVNSASASSLFFSSRPKETALLKPFFRVVFLGFIGRNLFILVSILSELLASNGGSNFTIYQLSNFPADLIASVPDTPQFGLLSGGLVAPVKSALWENSTVILHPDTSSLIDGWHALLSSPTKLNDLRNVVMSGSDDGANWHKISVPWRVTVSSRERFLPLPGEADTEDGFKLFSVHLDFTVSNFASEVENIISILGLGLAIFHSFRFQGRRAVLAVGWTFTLQGVSKVVAAALTQDIYLQLLETFAVPTYVAHGYGFVFLNRAYLAVLAGSGLFTVGCGFGLWAYFPHHSWLADLIIGMMQFMLFVAIVSRRQWVLAQARRSVQPDVDRYERVWSALTAALHSAEQLGALHDQVQRMMAAAGDGGQEVRQMTRHKTGAAAAHNRLGALAFKFSFRRGPGPPPAAVPVRSLDQLFLQATILSSVLKRKVIRWARDSGGMLLCREGGAHAGMSGYRTVEELDEQGGWGSVKWAGVKKAERAIQKLIRNYNLDPSRLLDLCRQSIVFESVHDLTSCLRCIEADPAAVCLRIKNRLAVDYDSWASAGYRDVAVNLRVVTEVTERLGVEEHVCEVQLILKCFADMKHDQGHARYVEYRNLRAE